MTRWWNWALVALVSSTPAFGQPAQTEQSEPSRQRIQRERGQRGERRQQQSRELIDQIAQELSLDEQQRAKLDEIAAEVRPGDKLGGINKEVSNLQDLREAVRKKDTAKADQIREQMRRTRSGGYAETLLERLEPSLTAEQKAKLPALRETLASAQGLPPGAPMPDRLARIKPALELDEKQAAEFDRLLADFRREYEKSESDSEAKALEMIDQLREAASAGDMERVGEIREQIGDSRGRSDEMVQAFLSDVERMLKPEQKPAFERVSRAFEPRGGPGAADDARRLLQAARRLELDRDQQGRLRDLERESMRMGRDSRRDPDGPARLYESVKSQLSEIIGADKVAELEQQLAERGPQRRRTPRPSEAPEPPPADEPIEPDNP